MNRLVHICQWGNDREKAWSGTYKKIYDELGKYYELEDIEIKEDFFDRLRNFMRHRNGKIKYDFAYRTNKNNKKHILQAVNHRKVCSFQYSEIDFDENVHSYIYQDMCMQYLSDIYNNDRILWKYYSHPSISKHYLEKRKIEQLEYYQQCSGIFTMGKWLADYIVETLNIPSDKVHAVGAGVDIDVKLIENSSKTKNKILFIGRGFATKGGDLLIKAFDILRKEYLTNAELYIIGPKFNPMSTEHEGIKFLGPLPARELVKYYSECDIFCMPSYFDAYGKVFIEALCCGLPCIARNAFAMKEIIQDGVNGYLIDDDNPYVLASKMYDLLMNDDIKSYVQKHMEDYRQQYSWETVVKKIIDVINQDEYMRG